ncbi:hypothetical protein LS70_005650 [Helicobacter sp. MIT 11-5569]|uniref:hypothetical protein n=1 Tax=Helicobacter sp. MIT 11-5569 TaxID=1548151 RepID=UPI00051FD357|nr:hypothetical protein [Helicobacter sp. MIT 11-5569]TLD83232.1 hypothetical protein LS70_005650 [Helicobacter sp. MIT 11-5569]
MTLIIKDVKEEFIKDFEALAKKTESSLSIERPKNDDFEQLRKTMLQDLKKPENRAVFERLKNK